MKSRTSLNHLPYPARENPLEVTWEVTRACSLSCRTCRPAANTRQHPLELTTPEAWRMVDQAARCDPARFILAGGDPLRRLNLESLIHYAAQKGLRVHLHASATPELCAADFRELKEAGLACIALRLDGAIQERHDRYRGLPGMWHRTMECILKAGEAGLAFEVHTALTDFSVLEMEEFAELLGDLQPACWRVKIPVLSANAAGNDDRTGHHLEALFEKLCQWSGSLGCHIQVANGNHYRRVAMQQRRRRCGDSLSEIPSRSRASRGDHGGAEPNHDARARSGDDFHVAGESPNGGEGRRTLFISHIGEIQPDSRLALSAGNVRTHDLFEVYQTHPLFRTLRDPRALKGKCGRCEFNVICGGSRSRAFAMTGDYLAQDPWCIYEPQANRSHSVPTTLAAG
ncbi:MAG TPA: radical SAM protein [Verrucomicrobiae bacterium]|nr:radical SAM protein [Verrucomicrobiae bacterium]